MERSDDSLSRWDAELSGAQRRAERRIEPGASAMVVASGVLLLLLSAVLPWIGSTIGWNVLLGAADVGVLARLFSFTSLGFGVLLSALALISRWWGLAWTCALGCGFSVINGVWAVWSVQTAPEQAMPNIGLVLALVAVLLLAVAWLRLVWSRPGGRANG